MLLLKLLFWLKTLWFSLDIERFWLEKKFYKQSSIASFPRLLIMDLNFLWQKQQPSISAIRPIRRCDYRLNFLLNNISISNAIKTKYLGLIFDQILFWKGHISEMKKKYYNKFEDTAYEADTILLLHIYCSLIFSKCDDGATSYSSSITTLLSSINTIYHSALLLEKGAFRITPCCNLCVNCNEVPSDLRRILIIFRFAARVR